MRAVLHLAMMETLQEFGRREGIIGPAEIALDFKELFATAAAKAIPLNAYQFMQSFESILFEISPMAREITTVAENEKNRPRANGKSYVETMAGALGREGARAVMYDAVAVEASRVVRGDQELKQYFTLDNGIINITSEAVKFLEKKRPDLYSTFKDRVLQGLAIDGSQVLGLQSKSQRAVRYRQ
jgi:hypothetical protein